MASTTALTEFVETMCRPFGVHVSKIAHETESAAYAAARLTIDGERVVFRVAKMTPTKLGQFVTLWKRDTPAAEIAPIDGADDVASVIIWVSDASRAGVFVFARQTLLDHDVMSPEGRGGRRALRVYPPWIPAAMLNKQATATQRWQLPWFVAFSA
jgi:hypothetical protein